MASVYALVAVVGAALTATLLWPLWGLAALLAAPFGASLSVLLAALGVLGFAPRPPAVDSEATDRMVSELRGVAKAGRGSGAARYRGAA